MYRYFPNSRCQKVHYF